MKSKQIYQLFIFIYFTVIGHPFYAQNSDYNSTKNPSSKKTKFITPTFENKVFIKEFGQFKKIAEERNINIPGTILFAVNNPEFTAYFTSKGITFLFFKTSPKHAETNEKEEKEERKRLNVSWETVNMEWDNHNTELSVTPSEKMNDYYTYGRFSDNSQYDYVPAYKKLYYSNLYEGVDVEFELPDAGGIKYKFIIRAGHTIPEIAYEIKGSKNAYLDNLGNLCIESKFGNLKDKAPVAFTNNTRIPARYNIKGKRVEITLENTSSIPLTEDIIIDPWITNPSLPNSNCAFDIQEDSAGNVFISGGASLTYNCQVQKYNTSGVLQWTHPYNQQFYGDIAVGNSGNTYIAEGCYPGKVTKLSPSGSVIYTAIGGASTEYWRLSFNKSKTILAMGGNFSPYSLSKIDTATGALTNTVTYPSDTWAVATDCNGDIYSLHQGASPCILRKTNADFTPSSSLVTTGFCISGYNNVHSNSTGFNALTISGPYLYIYDGLNLRRFLKSTLAIVDSVSVPNGTINDCSGIAFDYCGNIYVGTMSTIEKYDATLNHLSSIAAPNIVYDLLLSANGDLLACGKAFVANLGPTCPSPTPLSVTGITTTDASCIPGSATITANGGTLPYSYTWLPGSYTTDTLSNLSAGTYTVTIDDSFCQTYEDSITINQIPPLELSAGTITIETCINRLDGTATVNATGGRSPYSYSWNTTPAQYTATATGLSAGLYLATVVDADSCTDTVSVIIARNPNPIANFGSSSECEGTATAFNDSSVTSSGTINTWTWSFGDGSAIDLNQNPSHLYSPGSYLATLIIQNNFSCADTVTKPVQVYFNPVANFTTQDVCLNDSVVFTDSSYVHNSASITTWLWLFGDGTPTTTQESPVHFYTSEGTYNVTLLSTTSQGCSNATNKAVNVFDPPTTNFSVANVCLTDSAIFVNTSANPSMGTIASMLWSFGDGSLLNNTVSNPHHLYSAAGTYPVKLITRSSNLACADTVTDSITIFSMPIADFAAADVCHQQAVSFFDSSNVVNNNIIAAWNWTFGDTGTSTSQDPTHIYTAFGQYSIELIVTTTNGCKDTIAKDVVVHPIPAAIFSTSNVCLGNTTNFTNQSEIPENVTNDEITTWNWDFGDDSATTTTNTAHQYAATGSYTVELQVVSGFGCADSINKTVIINPNPMVAFTANDTMGCEPLCVNLTDASSVNPGANATWSWNLDDEASASGATALHCYSNDSVFAPKQFSVSLTVTSDSGCISTLTKSNYITVYPEPMAVFNVSPTTTTITNPVITISNLSTGANFWNWTFGGSITDTSSLQTPPVQTYAETGTYVIRLSTATQYNCADTSYQTIVIEPDFMFYVPNAFTPNDDGINDTFIGKGMFINEFEMIIFDRWGNLIFKTDNSNIPWDGSVNNSKEPAQTDVYIYVIKVSDLKANKYVYKGIVTLVR